MQARHLNRAQYFSEQSYTTRKYVIPFIEHAGAMPPGSDVLEIGCGDGGNMEPFLDSGHRVAGVDISGTRIQDARRFFSGHPNRENLRLVTGDIYQVGDLGKFDIIVIRDVLEHIHNQERFMAYIKGFLKPGGRVFLGFPPWHNPFGGHQQICRHPLICRLPFLHLLPGSAYRGVLRYCGESEATIRELEEIRETRITIERFLAILRRENYRVLKREYYLVNPNYEIKFKLKPRKQSALIHGIPYLRNFCITTCYFLIRPV